MARPSPALGTPDRVRVEIRALTGLRLVAALWVVLFHLQGGLAPLFAERLAWAWPVVEAGFLGVDLFFVLSGFVLTLSYLDEMGPRFSLRRAGTFLWARLSRVWPLWAVLTLGYGAWLAVADIDVGREEQYHRTVDLWHLLDQLFMVQMWHRDLLYGASFISPGWSLSVEFAAYAAFPLLVLAVYRLRRLPAAVLGLLAVAAMVPMAYGSYATGLDMWPWSWVPRIAGAFTAGALVCLVVRSVGHSPAVRRFSPRVVVLCLVEVGVVVIWAAQRSDQAGGTYAGAAIVLFPVLVGALAMSDTGVATFLSRDSLVLGGRFSFALYLVHLPVFEVYHHYASRLEPLVPGSPLWLVVQPQLVLVCLALAYLLWRFVEEPGRRFMQRVGPQGGRRTTAAAAPATPAPPPVAVPAAVVPPARTPRTLPPVPLPTHRAAVTTRIAVPTARRPAPAERTRVPGDLLPRG